MRPHWSHREDRSPLLSSLWLTVEPQDMERTTPLSCSWLPRESLVASPWKSLQD